jgi:hypothetical protein
MENLKTKFGIVIATYMRPDGKTPFYLNRTLNSILYQKFKNYKVFLIGDKYEDNDEFNAYGEGFNHNNFFKYNLPIAKERDLYLDKKILWAVGGCNASNYGIDLAISENIHYICRLDHDDWWEPNHLENFNEIIGIHNPDWICSKSTRLNHRVLPIINNTSRFIEFLPEPNIVVKSSTCINQKKIPLRTIDVYKETGEIYPGDANLWIRMSEFIKTNNLKSYLINEITCHHDEEGYTKRK